MPLIQFNTLSNDIEAVSGNYVQGHVFRLELGAISQGNSITIRYSNPNRIDVNDVIIKESIPNFTKVRSGSDAQGKYNVLDFFPSDDVYSLTFYIYDKYVNDYVELFKIIEE